MGSINESGHTSVCPRLISWMTYSWISVTIFFDKSLTCFSPKTLECAHINCKEQREPSTLKFLTRANRQMDRWPRPQGLLIGDAWNRRAAGSWTTQTGSFFLCLASQTLVIISTSHCCLPDQRARTPLCLCVFSEERESMFAFLET